MYTSTVSGRFLRLSRELDQLSSHCSSKEARTPFTSRIGSENYAKTSLKELCRSVEVVTTPGRSNHSRLGSSSQQAPPGTTLYEAILEIKRLEEENEGLRIEVEKLRPLDKINETLRADNETLRETNDAFQAKEGVYKHEVEKWKGQQHLLHSDQVPSVTVTLQGVPSGATKSTGTTRPKLNAVLRATNSMR